MALLLSFHDLLRRQRLQKLRRSCLKAVLGCDFFDRLIFWRQFKFLTAGTKQQVTRSFVFYTQIQESNVSLKIQKVKETVREREAGKQTFSL